MEKETNFLILCSDEHAPGALSCRGHPVIKTPNLDALAARGTTFTNAYSPSPICVPARASLATGVQVHENRCWSSAQPYHGQYESWMHQLRAAGRRVESIGKLHFRSAEDDHGFCEEHLPMYLANEGKGWPQGLIRDPMPGYPEAQEMVKEIGAGETDYTKYDRAITEMAETWLKENDQQKPWTLFVSYISPHYPLSAPHEFYDLYKDIKVSQPSDDPAIDRHPVLKEMRSFWNYDDFFDADDRALAVKGYYGLCSFLDHNIGKVLSALEASGELENTVILYISDHGEMLGSHGFWAKSLMYEDSVAVPMILAGPNVPTGENATPVSLTDVAATARATSGLEQPDQDGIWQTRNLLDIAKRPMANRFIFSEYHDGGSPTGFFMIRKGDWKYVYYAGGHPAQLFNLARDPGELSDLVLDPQCQTILAELHSHLLEVLDPEKINREAFAEQKARIDALGGEKAILDMPGFNHTPIG